MTKPREDFPYTAQAPGRVNLIGEHTDYNGGFVLPSAIPQRTQVWLRPRADSQVTGYSENVDGPAANFGYTLGEEKSCGQWWDYIQGVSAELRVHHGITLPGFDVRIASRVPLESGLSSSAALEVALLRGLREAFRLDLDDVTIARIGQQTENEFVGARVGIMDQMACSLAGEHAALFLDTRSLRYRQVPIPRECEFVVINSGIAHNHAGGDYNARRAECEAACAALGVSALRDVSASELEGPAIRTLPDRLRRRVRHVVTENARVLQAVEALEANAPERLGVLFSESHRSMRDDYEVSIPEIDRLVEIASAHRAVYGARLTGGGFGGSVVILTRTGAARDAAREIAATYAEATGARPAILVPDLVSDR